MCAALLECDISHQTLELLSKVHTPGLATAYAQRLFISPKFSSTMSRNTPTMESNHEPTTSKEVDVEKRTSPPALPEAHISAFKGLGWLDRLLALWILLAMIIGVLLGNFVPNVGPALQRGRFVGVSIPIGASSSHSFL